ncbi:hypothetical protein HELRODRAFT_185018 [Helobdella robusta]|uniref:CTCHY-type domain-containing protein n=1 Tax=Helobdella robusta TaxID=6412 RepID=T1FMA3_HELRO|nr:hypothetical protein HELRODRAFT_185018 [Helobdella robusta]ESO02720.1 hypothetical protein HELRODRAFT_185018 [Helobdella robusta]
MSFYSTVKVGIGDEILASAPKCPHGPTILFERFAKRGGHKKFFACSANRNRKLCNFYQLVERDGVAAKCRAATASANVVEDIDRVQDAKKYRNRWSKFVKQAANMRTFCRTCATPILENLNVGHDDGNDDDEHMNHNIMIGVTNSQLKRPTNLIDPLVDNHSNAQYMFSKETKDFLIHSIIDQKFNHVLCIGAPSIHEELLVMGKQMSGEKDDGCVINSYLLDLDERIIKMSPSSSHYNMFNHYFFTPSSKSEYLKFLKSARDLDESGSNVIILIDPPFGGFIELILFTLATVAKEFYGKDSKRELCTILFHPYFMEEKICSKTSFNMSDYTVTYENHKKLRKRELKSNDDDVDDKSVVRMFTNIPLSSIILPAHLGYQYCESCKKYVSQHNKHCSSCQACTTKVGKTYQHCEKCRRCVKSSWRHCDECGACELPDKHLKKKFKT